jgi:hypothetical protein
MHHAEAALRVGNILATDAADLVAHVAIDVRPAFPYNSGTSAFHAVSSYYYETNELRPDL